MSGTFASVVAASTPGCLATPLAEEAERFAARSGERFPFLDPARIKDAAGKRPGEPGHNPRTLHIPSSWYKDHKVALVALPLRDVRIGRSQCDQRASAS